MVKRMHKCFNLLQIRTFYCIVIFFLPSVSANCEVLMPPDTTKNFIIGIRAKAAAIPIIEDAYATAAIIGTELWYKRRHCIGIDFTWMRLTSETDDSMDVAMYDNYQHFTYLYLDYKYRFLPTEKVWWYLHLYGKSGKYKMWNKDAGYDHGSRDMSFLRSKTDGTFREPGIGIGANFFFIKLPNLGVDVSANYGIRLSHDNILDVTDIMTSEYRENVHSEAHIFYLRWSLTYLFR